MCSTNGRPCRIWYNARYPETFNRHRSGSFRTGHTSRVADGRWGNRVNSGNTAANASIASSGRLQNWRRAVAVKSGQSSAGLRLATAAAPAGKLALHIGPGNDALANQPSIQFGPQCRWNVIVGQCPEKVVPRLIGRFRSLQSVERRLVDRNACDRVVRRHHVGNDGNDTSHLRFVRTMALDTAEL
jgi:hypothetical protein